MQSFLFCFLILFSNSVFSDKSPVSYYKKNVERNVSNSSQKERKHSSIHKEKERKLIAKEVTNNKYLGVDVLGEDFHTTLSSDKVHFAIKQYLGTIKSTCHIKMTKVEKLKMVTDNLQHLRDYSGNILEQYNLKLYDRVDLLNIFEHTDPKRVHYNKKNIGNASSFCKQIKKEFNKHYIYSYNLPKKLPLNKYPHKWVSTILESLNCICK